MVCLSEEKSKRTPFASIIILLDFIVARDLFSVRSVWYKNTRNVSVRFSSSFYKPIIFFTVVSNPFILSLSGINEFIHPNRS